MNKRFTSSIIFICALFLIGVSQLAQSADFAPTIENARNAISGILQDEAVTGLSVALVSDNEIVWQEGFGFADKENQIPATIDTVYAIGSISKTFAAVSVLQQVDQGKVDLDQPVSQYLPEFSLLHRYGASQQEQNDAITVRHLLNHHSGIPGDIYPGMINTGPSYYPQYIEWMLDYLSNTYPAQEAGKIASYCNTGFVLAGEIARRAGAQDGEDDYGKYLEWMVLEPLGMDHSTTHIYGKEIADLAAGYSAGFHAPDLEMNGVATGGVYSTVTDMSQFMMMLMSEGISPKDNARFLATETVKDIGRFDQGVFDVCNFFVPGLGLDCASLYRFIDVIPPIEEDGHSYGRAWAKDGSTSTFASLMYVLPDHKLGVIVLFNCDEGNNYKYGLVEQILLNAYQDKFSIAIPEPELPDYSESAITDPSIIAGQYVKSGQRFEIRDAGDGALLLVSNPDTVAATESVLAPFNGSHFSVEDNPVYYTFVEIEDRLLLLKSADPESTMSELMVGISGEKIEPVDIPDAWRDRVGYYVMDDIPPYSGEWSPFETPLMELSIQNDSYLIFGYLTLPQSDTVTFIPGISNRFDSRILADSDGGLYGGGLHFIPFESIPSTTIGESFSFEVSYSSAYPRSIWRKFNVDEHTNAMIKMSANDDNFVLHLYGSNFNWIGENVGSLETPLEPGSYYLAISPGFDAPQQGTFSSTIDASVSYWELY